MAEIFWHNLEIKEIEKTLRGSIEKGLSEKEVQIRQKEYGKNKLPEENPAAKLKIFYEQFKSPLIYILLFAGFINLALKGFADAAVIFGAVFLNALFGFFQENKTSQTLRALKKIVRHEAKVLREGSFKIIDSEEIVAGDIVLLSPGDKVPADGRVIDSYGLKINEMALTGEWLASDKSSAVLAEETVLADRDNMAYMGTVIEDGRGKVIVTETGIQTEIGKIAKMVREAKEEKTPYQKKLADFSKIVGVIIALIAVFIFVVGLSTGKDFGEMFTLAVAVAVAAIPEGLPVAMTVILALGAQRILSRKGLVRKLASVETLGSTAIIATDKTGTITEGKMKVEKIIGDPALALKAAVLSSEAFIENPGAEKGKWDIRGRPTERAVLEAAVREGLYEKMTAGKKKIIDLPFNPINKFAAALYEERGEKFLYVCGAPEKVLEFSKMTEEEKARWENKLEEASSKGLRVVAAAVKSVRDPTPFDIIEAGHLLVDLTFAGLIVLNDPIRADAKEAIKICRQAGMKPIIVTGDYKATAKAVAEELGLKIRPENIMEGRDLDNIGSAEEFDKILPQIQIYARVEPRHKLKIIEAWQRRGEVVAMTGDGINDAPALKRADIGVALGSGTEAAKEASDLILLNDGFSIIVAAVEEGRAIIDNIRKVITYLLTDSFTEIILIAGSMLISWLTAAPWLLPVAASQILWVNLIEDGPVSLSLAFEPKEKDLMRQKTEKRVALLTKEMKFLIFIIGIVTDLLLLGLFFWLLEYSGYEISHIRSIIFSGLAINSIFYIFSCRSLRRNIWQMNPFSNKFLVVSLIFGIVALLAALYFSPLQMLLKTQPLNFFDWKLLVGLGFLNIILIEITKWYFINKAKRHA